MSEPVGSFPPPPPPPTLPPASAPGRAGNQAIAALVCGILGITCCGLLAPIAWYLGTNETKAIRAGVSPIEGATLANVGRVLGIVGSVLLLLSIVWIFAMGGMAVLQGMMNR